MSKYFVGHLPVQDPLHDYLQYDILPRIGQKSNRPTFRVFRLAASNEVYLYQEKRSQVQVIGKFFARHNNPKMEKEFHNLCLLRSYGLVHQPHIVVRPLQRCS